MPLKRAEELFDIGGTQLPIDEGNPDSPSGGGVPALSGNTTGPYDAATRGIGFGEQLTSYGANRISYALALNTDDLDDRVIALTAAGLDGAYNAGRIITKDAGAVTTESSLTTAYADDPSNAHYRADASGVGETLGGSTGFDFKAKRLAGTTGFLDRRLLTLATSFTTVTAGMAATLNPGGAGATLIRLSGANFSTASVSDLIGGYDLVEVSGAGAASGLYQIVSCTLATGTDATLVRLDGVAPSFTSGTACLANVYRPGFRTILGTGQNSAMVGFPGSQSVLDLVPGTSDNELSSAGSRAALRVLRKNLDAGGVVEQLSIDAFGRILSTLSDTTSVTDLESRSVRGTAALVKEYLGGATSGQGIVVWQSSTSAVTRRDFLALSQMTTTGTLTITFVANSPTLGFVEITTVLPGGWQRTIQPNATYGYISGSSTNSGLYVVIGTLSGPNRLIIRKLDGDVPSDMDNSGTETMRLFYGQRIGSEPVFTVNDPLGSLSVAPSNIFSSSSATDGAALALFQGSSTGTMLRCLFQETTDTLAESAKINDLGVSAIGFATGTTAPVAGRVLASSHIVTSAGSLEATNGFVISLDSHDITGATGTFNYTVPRSTTAILSPHILLPLNPTGGGGDIRWDWSDSTGRLGIAGVAGVSAQFCINQYLPTGCVLTLVEALIEPGSVQTGADRMQMDIYGVTYDFTTFGPSAVASIASVFATASATDIEVISSGVISVPMGGAAATTTILSITTSAGSDALADWIHAFRFTFTEVGPRNT